MTEMYFPPNSNYKETYLPHELPRREPKKRELWMKPTEPFDSTTTAQIDFRGEYNHPSKSMRPDRGAYTSDAPFDPNTTTATSYKPHELPIRYKHEPDMYIRPDGIMDLHTTNETQYQPHAVQRQIGQKPSSSNILKGKGQFATETNYHNSFLGNGTERVANMKPANDYQPPSIPMDSATVNKSDFLEHQITPRRNFKPKSEVINHDKPFDDSTDYKEQFKQHKIEPRVRRQKEEYAGLSAPMDTTTTAKESYQGVYQRKRDAINPDRTPYVSNAPFDATTTMNNAYKEVEIPQRRSRRPAEYSKPEGTMDMTTTHNTNFLAHSVSKQKINKPGSSGILKGSGDFSKTTNYQGDFFPRQVERVKMVKPENLYEPPKEPMNGQTTNSIDFHQKEVKKQKSFKPVSEIMKSTDRFDDTTSYKDRFVQHELTPRRTKAKQAHEPPSAPLDDRTTARDSFQGAYQEKRGSFKPDNGFIKSEIPFESGTTAGVSFKAWPVANRYVHRPDEYKKPEGTMDLTTMNREAYKEVKATRVPMNRLRSSNLLSYGGKFDSTSSYSGDFVQKPLGDRKRIKANNQYVPPAIPFDDQTEYRTKLIGYVAPKEKSCKPDNGLSDTLGQRDQRNPYRVPQSLDWRELLNMKIAA